MGGGYNLDTVAFEEKVIQLRKLLFRETVV